MQKILFGIILLIGFTIAGQAHGITMGEIAEFNGTYAGDWIGFTNDRIAWSFSASSTYIISSMCGSSGFGVLTLRAGIDGNIYGTSSAGIADTCGTRYNFSGGVSIDAGTFFVQPSAYSALRYNNATTTGNFTAGQLYFHSGIWYLACPPFPFPSCGNYAGENWIFEGIAINTITINSINGLSYNQPIIYDDTAHLQISYTITDASDTIWVRIAQKEHPDVFDYQVIPITTATGTLTTKEMTIFNGEYSAYAFSMNDGTMTSDWTITKDFLVINDIMATSSTINFAYPVNGMTTGQFSPFLLTTTGLNVTHAYTLKLDYGETMTSSISAIGYGTGIDWMQQGIKIPADMLKLSFTGSSTTIHAFVQLYDAVNPYNAKESMYNQILIATDEIDFTLLSPAESGNKIITPKFTTIFPSSTSTATSSLSGWATGLVQNCEKYPFTTTFLGTIPFLANTALSRVWCDTKNVFYEFSDAISTKSISLLIGISGTFANVFPVSVFTNLNNDIKLAVANRPASTEIVIEGWEADGIKYFGGTGTIYSILNESSTQLLDNTGWEWRDLISNIMYVLTGIIIILFAIEGYRMLRPPVNN